MTDSKPQNPTDRLCSKHEDAWRDPLEIPSQIPNIASMDSKLFECRIHGQWWQVIAELGITLFVTREYEHLILAFGVVGSTPRVSFYPLPHPSGMVFHPEKNTLFIAGSRNPNQVFSFQPVAGFLDRLDVKPGVLDSYISLNPLVPVRCQFFPGCTYLHDLAIIGQELHANAVGHNAVIRISDDGRYQRVWWPKCIERDGRIIFGGNYLQLNSIAAGADIGSSYFSASTDRISSRRPGHKNFKVDKQGVVFSGMTREPIVKGLTRPHSVRIHHGRIWVDNSGYGELGFVEDRAWRPFIQLPGWTRGLYMIGSYAFVGTSRVSPRFRQYAPGVDMDSSVCGIHIVDLSTGRVTGSVIWPFGNQLFSVEGMDAGFTLGFPTKVGSRRSIEKERNLYYSYGIEGDLTDL